MQSPGIMSIVSSDSRVSGAEIGAPTSAASIRAGEDLDMATSTSVSSGLVKPRSGKISFSVDSLLSSTKKSSTTSPIVTTNKSNHHHPPNNNHHCHQQQEKQLLLESAGANLEMEARYRDLLMEQQRQLQSRELLARLSPRTLSSVQHYHHQQQRFEAAVQLNNLNNLQQQQQREANNSCVPKDFSRNIMLHHEQSNNNKSSALNRSQSSPINRHEAITEEETMMNDDHDEDEDDDDRSISPGRNRVCFVSAATKKQPPSAGDGDLSASESCRIDVRLAGDLIHRRANVIANKDNISSQETLDEPISDSEANRSELEGNNDCSNYDEEMQEEIRSVAHSSEDLNVMDSDCELDKDLEGGGSSEGGKEKSSPVVPQPIHPGVQRPSAGAYFGAAGPGGGAAAGGWTPGGFPHSLAGFAWLPPPPHPHNSHGHLYTPHGGPTSPNGEYINFELYRIERENGKCGTMRKVYIRVYGVYN